MPPVLPPPLEPPEDISRPAAFTGRPGETTYTQFNTRGDANDWARGIAEGDVDKFLGQTYTSIKVTQQRNPNGTFASGFTVTVNFVRPGPGDTSNPPPFVLAPVPDDDINPPPFPFIP